MILSTFFTDAGIPKTGLSPTIIITDITDITTPLSVSLSHVVVEIGNGLYAFNFSEYTHTHLYTVRIDGGVILNDTDRYKFGAIDTDNNILNTEIEAIKIDTANTLIDTATIKGNETTLLADTVILKADTTTLKGNETTLLVDTGILKIDVDELQVDTDSLLVDTGILKADTTIIKGNETSLLVDTATLKSDTSTLKTNVDDVLTGIADIKGTGWATEDNLKNIYDSIAYGDWTDDEKKQIRSALGIHGTKITATGGQLQSITTNIDFVKKIEGGRWRRDGVQMIFYAEDNTTEIARFNLFDKDGNPAGELADAFERVRV